MSPPDMRRGRPRQAPSQGSQAPRPRQPGPAYAAHFRARVLADAYSSALASTWERRAEMFDWATPRPGDYQGQATDAELTARQARCDATATACRRQALLLRQAADDNRGAADIAPDVLDLLAGVAA